MVYITLTVRLAFYLLQMCFEAPFFYARNFELNS